MKKIIGIGDLVCDLYYVNNKLIGINGGKSFSNIIFNLANMGISTEIIGTCGNDIFGKIALKSLKEAGVNISDVKILNTPTNLLHINITNGESSTRCPKCNLKKWNKYVLKDIVINKDDIILVDSTRYLSLLSNNIVFIDVGYCNELKKMNKKQFNNFLNFKFEIINMNNRVAKYLMTTLNLNSESKLFNNLKTKVLIITKGKNGTSYYFNKTHIDMKLTNISQEVDSNGAGDLFFASTIKDYLNNNLIFDEKFIKTSFNNTTMLTKEVVKVIGARTYYQALYKAKKIKKYCTCEKISI